MDDLGLPGPIAGGWADEVWPVFGKELHLRVPADPDALLDDPAVHEANAATDYMPYWAYRWPAAGALVNVLPSVLSDGAVLELGCGLGRVALAAASLGHDVLATDHDPTAVDLVRFNAAANGLTTLSAETLDWIAPPQRTWPTVVASDVVYEPVRHASLMECLNAVVGRVAWLSDPGRSAAAAFVRRATEQWEVEVFDESLVPAPLRSGETRLIRLTRPRVTPPSAGLGE